MKAAKPFLFPLLLAAFLAGCGDSSTGSDGGDSSEELSSGTSFVPGSSDEETSGSSSSRVGKSSAKVSSSSSIAVDYNALCGATPYDSTTHFCDIRDSAVYAMVRIGSQTWMAENLNYEYKVNGSTYGNWCYNDSALYCERYGRLYTWAAAMDSATTGCGYGATCETDAGAVQGICPDGLHLPSRAEWVALFMVIGGQSTAGTALKASSGWHDNGSGTDAYGFSVFPSGYRNGGGDYSHVGNGAYFWSASEDDASIAYHMFLGYSYAHAFLDSGYNKYNAFAVRCMKDSD